MLKLSTRANVGIILLLLIFSVILWNIWVLVLAVFLGVHWAVQPWVQSNAARHTPAPESENVFETGTDFKSRLPFPSLLDDNLPLVSLSVVVPAYNEEFRLGKMLDEAIGYLQVRQRRDPGFSWEIIVVDDGSKDNTYKVALTYSDKYSSECVRVLKLAKNCGKGGAVKKGMLRSRGRLVLMADADGSTTFQDVEKLEGALQRIKQDGIVFGSRAHLDQGDRSSELRSLVSRVFQLYVSVLVPGNIRDTQCGFKLFSRNSAKLVFPLQKMNGWCFDCELLFLARARFAIPVLEVGVDWTDVDGSKLDVVNASLDMARDILLMYILYGTHMW